jgi:hypothetical protein
MLASFLSASPAPNLDCGKLNEGHVPLPDSKIFVAIAIFLVWEHYAGLLHLSQPHVTLEIWPLITSACLAAASNRGF